jgi:hypothetical protein
LFDVESYLKDTLPPGAMNCKAAAKPKPKVHQLIELIDAARSRMKD